MHQDTCMMSHQRKKVSPLVQLVKVEIQLHVPLKTYKLKNKLVTVGSIGTNHECGIFHFCGETASH